MAERPQNLHASKSFTRLESTRQTAPNATSRSRASTLQGPPMPAIDPLNPLKISLPPQEEDGQADADVFAGKAENDDTARSEFSVPDRFEELPIEIRSLTERFLESLSAKVHPSPLTADALSDLFQDFYTRASAKINTHIATLSARLTSDSFKRTASSRQGSIRSASGDGAEQQMLSVSEMSDRKKARRDLETKRAALEEAVERAVCEKVYERIWRHRSTDDEERDHKLRSRTAALSLVGIGLTELLMTGEALTEEERTKAKEREGEVRGYLSSARDDLLQMNDINYPLGKLQHLTAAHKSIVDALSKIFPASSSADEILPTLIYTLITMPPESLNVISHLKFVQRFRGSSRVDGETAYCLVNLEAAVSFLETVDLSSLRAEERKPNSRPTTPRSEVTPMALGLADAPDLVQGTQPKKSSTMAPPSPTTKANRRLSNLITTQTNRIEAASDAVRESIIDSADQALGRINNTLDNSFKFLFGRMKEMDPNSPVDQPALPKTLEEARQLVTSPSKLYHDDENASISATSSLVGDDRRDDRDLGARMTDLFAGRRPIRDRSADSVQSGGSNSGRRIAFTASSNDGKPALSTSKTEPTSSPSHTTTANPPTNNNTSAVDSILNIGNSINPLNRFAGMNVLPRFGRTSTNTTPTTPTPSALDQQNKQLPSLPPTQRSVSHGEFPAAHQQADDKASRAVAALEALRKTTPPVKKFLDAKDAQDLKVREVDELLREYQRLAGALRGAINY